MGRALALETLLGYLTTTASILAFAKIAGADAHASAHLQGPEPGEHQHADRGA